MLPFHKRKVSICTSAPLTPVTSQPHPAPGTLDGEAEIRGPYERQHSSINKKSCAKAKLQLNKPFLRYGGDQTNTNLGKQPQVVCSQNCCLPDLEEVSRRVPAALRASQPPIISLQSLVTCTHGILVRSCILYTLIVQVCYQPPSVGSREAVTQLGAGGGTHLARASTSCLLAALVSLHQAEIFSCSPSSSFGYILSFFYSPLNFGNNTKSFVKKKLKIQLCKLEF